MGQAKSPQEAVALPQPLLHDTPSGTLTTIAFLFSGDTLVHVQNSVAGTVQRIVDAAGMCTAAAHMW